MRITFRSLTLLCLTVPTLARPPPAQHILVPTPTNVDEAHILSVASRYDDPVEAMLFLDPSQRQALSEPRLIELMSTGETKWMTEGDKLRLRRAEEDFIDWTGRSLVEQGFQADASTPNLTHQAQISKIMPHLSTVNMFEFLETFTSFYNRLYTSESGVKSQRWLFDQITDIARSAPPTCRLSIEQFPHRFPQNSIIARFSPRGVRNVSQPVTIVGAHPDSVNYYFPLLNAPGADDDGSGTATILEAFRTLVHVGYEPVNGPVEFHWWAGEEAGLLGSADVAEDYRSRGISVSAILNVDETAFVKANSTPAINLVEVGATQSLMKWVHALAEEYADIGVKFSGMVLDHQSWTRHGYPAVSIVEGDQAEGGWLPFPHTVLDRTDIAPNVGTFSYEHMKQFAKVTIAFVIEQAGMADHNWRPSRPVPTATSLP